MPRIAISHHIFAPVSVEGRLMRREARSWRWKAVVLRHVGQAERSPRTFTCSSRQDRWKPLRQQSVTSTGSSRSSVLSRQIGHAAFSELLFFPLSGAVKLRFSACDAEEDGADEDDALVCRTLRLRFAAPEDGTEGDARAPTDSKSR